MNLRSLPSFHLVFSPALEMAVKTVPFAVVWLAQRHRFMVTIASPYTLTSSAMVDHCLAATDAAAETSEEPTVLGVLTSHRDTV